jgi:hypothetical protein
MIIFREVARIEDKDLSRRHDNQALYFVDFHLENPVDLSVGVTGKLKLVQSSSPFFPEIFNSVLVAHSNERNLCEELSNMNEVYVLATFIEILGEIGAKNRATETMVDVIFVFEDKDQMIVDTQGVFYPPLAS